MIRGLLLVGLSLLSNVAVTPAAEKAVEPSAELRAFAQQLVKIFESQDRKAFAELIDWEHIYDQGAFGKFEFISAQAKRTFKQGYLEASRDPEKPFYAKYLRESQLITLLQIKSVGEHLWVITIRLFVEGESGYLVLHVKAAADQHPKIVDIDWGTKATSLVEGSECGALVAHQYEFVKSMGPLEKLRPWLNENRELYADFMKACAEEEVEEIIKLYPQLAPGIRSMPANEFHYYRAHAAVKDSSLNLIDIQAYYEKNKSPGVLKQLERYYQTHEDYEAALKCYDEFDRLLPVDPLNNLYRAQLLTDLKKFDQAYACANKLINDYPNWQRSYITLMVVSLFDKNYKTTLKQLQLLRDKFQVDLAEHVDTNDDYKDFLKSPEYAVWKKENDAAKAKQDPK